MFYIVFENGNINPFRYRSYYYDKETGWYYLNSRYYNPLLLSYVNQSEEYETNLTYFNSLISAAFNINDYNTNELDYNSSISNQGIRDVVKFKETLLEGQILSYKNQLLRVKVHIQIMVTKQEVLVLVRIF